jgi:putative DNA primase/helicase
MSAPCTAAELAKALRGHRDGRGFRALCPAHNDRTPSMSIDDAAGGRILLKCWSGCPQSAIIDALKRRGLWDTKAQRDRPIARNNRDPSEIRRENTPRAGEIWRATRPIAGTIAEHYLRDRGLTDLPGDFDQVVRFHPDCPFGARVRKPCMVALYRNIQTNAPQAVHRTALTADGKKIDRKSLGSIQGAAIKLCALSEEKLTIGEGIETTLAGMAMGFSPAWAVGSALGIERFPLLPDVAELTVLVDRDPSGRGESAARACVFRWVEANRKIRRVFPKLAVTKADMNDVLLADGAA